MGCLHDPANVQQTSSNRNGGRLLDRVYKNAVLNVHESKLVRDVVLGIGRAGALSISSASDVVVVGGTHCAMMSSRPISLRARCNSAWVAGRSPPHSHELIVACACVPVSIVPPMCATSASLSPSAMAKRGQSSSTRSATSVSHVSETGICMIPAHNQ